MLNLGKPVSSSFQLLSSFNMYVPYSLLSAISITVIESGLTRSLSSSSVHTFVTFTPTVSNSWVFVIVYPVQFLVIVAVYPSGVLTSSTAYMINSPFSYFGKSSKALNQLFSSLSVIVVSSCVFPLIINITVTSVGLILSLLSVSFHTLDTLTTVVSGICVFVMV